MKLGSNKTQVLKVLEFTTNFHFNVLRVGTVFRQSGLSLVVGGEDGIVRIYDLQQQPLQCKVPQVSLETKSGPIQAMGIDDVTKFYHKDLVVGDSCGMLTVFCNQQILCRQSLSTDSINCLQMDRDATGNCSIVAGDESGSICCILPSSELWRINLNDLSIAKEPCRRVTVKCLLAVTLTDQNGRKSNYILASDDMCRIHVIHQGSVVSTVKSSSVVTAMCTGHFIHPDKLDVGNSVEGAGAANVRERQQVALGSTTGSIHIFHNFMLTEDEFANASYPIVQLAAYPKSESDLDYMLCVGNFNSLQVYWDGKKASQYTTPDWVSSMEVADIDKDGRPEVVLGCLDNSVLALKIEET